LQRDDGVGLRKKTINTRFGCHKLQCSFFFHWQGFGVSGSSHWLITMIGLSGNILSSVATFAVQNISHVFWVKLAKQSNTLCWM
jgi:hypothetical protein